MTINPLLQLHQFGQSVWLDLLRRGMISGGEFQQMIEQDGLRGVTSNPAIFEKAIVGSHDYDDAIRTLAQEGRSVSEIYETLTVEDVGAAADLFRPLFDETDGQDGFVSLEVSPLLARDTQGTLKEARHLWTALNRPNVMIKVPGTAEGLPAITTLISEGINVNVTLLFGLPRYGEVVEAFLAGLERRKEQGKSIKNIASVASFFLSRIDVLIDEALDAVIRAGGPSVEQAKSLQGEVAIASAKLAYEMYQNVFQSKRFQTLAQAGARPQRLLWASTSTKNPAYSDVKYVEALIGENTVNTLPLETLQAYRDHGQPAPRLLEGLEKATKLILSLPGVGVDLDAVTQQLIQEGIEKFEQPYNKLLKSLDAARTAALSTEAVSKQKD